MPTQQELDFRATGGGQTQSDRLQALFEAHPGEWLELPDLAKSISAFAVHSRVADLRKRGMRIENRTTVDPTTRQRHSFYRYEPGQ